MDLEEHGELSALEIARAIEYLRKVGLTDKQICGFWAFVATGHLFPDVMEKETAKKSLEPYGRKQS